MPYLQNFAGLPLDSMTLVRLAAVLWFCMECGWRQCCGSAWLTNAQTAERVLFKSAPLTMTTISFGQFH